jgi:hypothetical protein
MCPRIPNSPRRWRDAWWQGFDVSSQRFLYSLLQYYGLELHNLPPQGSCTSQPLWLCVRPSWGSTTISTCGITSFMSGSRRARMRKWQFWEGVVIHVKSEHGFNPYFNIPLPKLNNGWRKMWFFLRNNAAASLPTFIGNRPIPQTNWGYVVAKKYLRKLQTLREVVQQLP